MQPLIIANWKMNFNLSESIDFCASLEYSKSKLLLAPPSPYLAYLADKFHFIGFCGQNVSHITEYGSYTGEYSATMLKSCKVNYAMIGHNERRTLFNESSEMISQKITNCLNSDVTPILCIGEPLEARNKKEHKNYLLKQLNDALVSSKDAIKYTSQMIIAYEPIWSIGTNIIPTNEELVEIFNIISDFAEQSQVASNIKLVYGGSVNLDNIDKILAINSVCGVLIGKTSLNKDQLLKILNM